PVRGRGLRADDAHPRRRAHRLRRPPVRLARPALRPGVRVHHREPGAGAVLLDAGADPAAGDADVVFLPPAQHPPFRVHVPAGGDARLRAVAGDRAAADALSPHRPGHRAQGRRVRRLAGRARLACGHPRRSGDPRVAALPKEARLMPRPRSDIQPRLIHAARDRFLREGVDGASLRDIARDAGTNIGMLYYYFPTKDDLFLAVVERRSPGLPAALTAALPPALPPAERLLRMYRRVGRMSEDDLVIVKLIVREALVSSQRLERLIARFMRGHLPLIVAT